MEARILRETIEKIDEIFGKKPKAEPIKKSELDQSAFVKYATDGIKLRFKAYSEAMAKQILSEMKDDSELAKDFPIIARAKAKQMAEDARRALAVYKKAEAEFNGYKKKGDQKNTEIARQRVTRMDDELSMMGFRIKVVKWLANRAKKYKQKQG